MRKIKFRAWNIDHKRMEYISDLYWFEENGVLDDSGMGSSSDYILEQFTGLRDKNGKEIYFGDLLRIKRTLNDGQFVSNAIYNVEQGSLCGLELHFVCLADNGDVSNQYPIDNTLCERLGSLDLDCVNQHYDRIAVPDTFGQNNLYGKRWKSSDYSNDIEVIGNIHENADLLK